MRGSRTESRAERMVGSRRWPGASPSLTGTNGPSCPNRPPLTRTSSISPGCDEFPPAAGLEPGPEAGFPRDYHADAEPIVVQKGGQRWLLDAVTGRTRAAGPAPADPWPTPPVALDARRLAVVEDGRVVAIDRSSGA